MRERQRWLMVVLFAVAMAWMEAATMVYLRMLVGRVEPYQPDPLPIQGHLGATEIAREAATMLMLFAVGWLAGSTARTRLGYWLIAFGVWDVFYYLFLAVIGGWPRSVLDWDVLFLIPLPWWGPVLAPVLIASLMAAGGTLVTQFDVHGKTPWPGRNAWLLNGAGCLLALGVLMLDAILAAPHGSDAVARVLPTRFHWPPFLVAALLIAAPVADVARQLQRGCRFQLEAAPSGE